MVKERIYLRVGKTRRGLVVQAHSKPVYRAIETNKTYRGSTYNPTVLLAVDLDIPDKEFDKAKNLLDLKIKSSQPAIELKEVTDADSSQD